MKNNKTKIKNLKISEEVHSVLKKYCEKKGMKIYKFLEDIIMDRCKSKPDIYGEN